MRDYRSIAEFAHDAPDEYRDFCRLGPDEGETEENHNSPVISQEKDNEGRTEK